MKILFERLLGSASASDSHHAAKAADVTLREAASAAYESALAPFHTGIVRGVVRAGLLTLPSKEQFIHSVGKQIVGSLTQLGFLSCMQIGFYQLPLPCSDILAVEA